MPARAGGPRYWMQGVVLALGLASIVMLIGTNWIREKMMTQDVALVQAVGELQAREAISHLWMEEYLTGDHIHLSEAWENQDRALYLIETILEGGAVADGRYYVEPIDDPGLREQALGIRRQIDEFRTIAQTRLRGYERGENVGIGSPLDVEFDDVFHRMLDDMRRLQASVDDILEDAHHDSEILFRSILIAWVVIVSLAVIGLWSRERRRYVAEAALRESQAQLQQAQKMEAVGRLAGGLAHDINNYLAAITSQAELAKLAPGDQAKQDERLDSIIGTTSRAAGLIRRLLAFSRREAVQHRVVNVNRVVEDLRRMLERLIGEDVRMHLELEPELWNVKIDPGQIEQTIVNLVVNARDAMPTGGSVTIRTRNHHTAKPSDQNGLSIAAGDYVELSVADTGTGIPPDIRDRVFEPFVTTKNKATSSGLGLATVYGIVKQSRGGIRLETEVGRGTTLRLLLPRTMEGMPREMAPSASKGTRGSQRVLLVEDNEALCVSTKESLEVLGYQVVAVPNGEVALAIFDADFDVLVTDVVMPGMNGRELMERLRQRTPNLPVIFMSGYTDDVILRHGITESEVDFLSKPFRVEQLAQKIREVLDRGGRRLATSASTILVVEDDTLMLGALQACLGNEGFRVETAKDGREGLECFQAHPDEIGCVLLDLGLPRLGGHEVFRELRKIQSRLPVILMSGRDEEELARRFPSDGITGILQKPFEMAMLAGVLQGVLRSGKVPDLGRLSTGAR